MFDIGYLILHDKALRKEALYLAQKAHRLGTSAEITRKHLEIRLLEHNIDAHFRILGNELVTHPVGLFARVAPR